MYEWQCYYWLVNINSEVFGRVLECMFDTVVHFYDLYWNLFYQISWNKMWFGIQYNLFFLWRNKKKLLIAYKRKGIKWWILIYMLNFVKVVNTGI